jgi:rare lipoprotein A
MFLSIVVLVTSCTTAELAKSMVQGIYKHTLEHKKTGYYKVGKPYKIRGKWYTPKVNTNYNKVGVASWYGDAFDGKLTANGEEYDLDDFSAAHKTLPLPSMVKVTNVENGRHMLVRINDRGPYVGNRIIDLSEATARKLGLFTQGTGRVRVEFDNEATNEMFAHKSHVKYKRPAAHVGGTKLVSSGWGFKKESKSKKSTSNKGGLFVQTGAYKSRESARGVAKNLSEFSRVLIQEVRVRNEIIYRVRMGSFSKEKEADVALNKAINMGYENAIIVRN